jgi:hypothetical protein
MNEMIDEGCADQSDGCRLKGRCTKVYESASRKAKKARGLGKRLVHWTLQLYPMGYAVPAASTLLSVLSAAMPNPA